MQKSVSLFLSLTLLLSLPFYYYAIQTGEFESLGTLGILGLMWAPGLSAILTNLFLKHPLSSIGWKFGTFKFMALSYLIPLIYIAISYFIASAAGITSFPNPEFLNMLNKNLGFTDNTVLLILGFVVAGTAGVLILGITTLGEEMGWRGFLFSRLYSKYGLLKSSILTGIIWALWHYPIMIFSNYNNGGNLLITIPVVTIFILIMSVLMGWLYAKTQSLWSAVIFHAVHNSLIQSYFDMGFTQTDLSKYLLGDFGALTALVAFVILVVVLPKNSPLKIKPVQVENTIENING